MNLLSVTNVSKTFELNTGVFCGRASRLKALDSVSVSLEEGKVMGILGESGSGKTTLGRVICRLMEADEGEVRLDGKYLKEYSRAELASKVQMIFQDPFASLNPKLKIGTMLSEAADGRDAWIGKILDMTGLTKDILNLYPHHFSGGQRQRIAIARALLKEPKLVVADEPLSSLDMSIQAQILALFMRLRDALGISLIFISHDVVTTGNIADYLYVMHNGRIAEHGAAKDILCAPATEYTKKLLSAVPH